MARVTRMTQIGLARVFPQAEYDVVYAESEADVIAKSLSHSPDVIILDMTIPGTLGEKSIRQIRSLSRDMESVVQMREMGIVVVTDSSRGSLNLQSALRAGATVALEKPLTITSLRNCCNKLLESELRTNNTRVRTVLAVDGEARVRQLYESIFVDLDACDIVTVEDALHALEHVELQPTSLIITEQYLPDMTGLELIRTLKEVGKEIPVMMVSSVRDESIQSEVRELGVIHYVTKPFVVDELKRLVRCTLTEGCPVVLGPHACSDTET